jgi:putative transcriptional regulator
MEYWVAPHSQWDSDDELRFVHCDLLDCAGFSTEEEPMKNRLRVLRAEREWSQADLAERLGVSRQSVNAIETGKFDPSLPLAFKLARLFQSTVESIFQEDVQT